MVRWRRQNFVSLPQVLSSVSENTHWNLSTTMLSCPWSIWDSFRCLTSNTSKRSFGWIIIKIHNKIKYLKVLTYAVRQHSQNDRRCLHTSCDDGHTITVTFFQGYLVETNHL